MTKLAVLFYILLSLVLCAFKPQRLVYIESSNRHEGFKFNESTGEVNLFIDTKVISDRVLQKQIKMYLAYQYVKNGAALEKAFIRNYKITFKKFAATHRKQISSVIYYLELSEHGNLPVIYHMEAYALLNKEELKPEITQVKQRLEKGGMLMIDVVYDDRMPVIRLDSLRIKPQ